MSKWTKLGVDIATGFSGGVSDFVSGLFETERKTVYDATWAKPTDYASRWNKGFSINGRHNITIKESFSNMLILGGTGSGKSSSILVPGLFNLAKNSSLIIHDPSIELLPICAPYFQLLRIYVDILNYSDPTHSIFYNPLYRARTLSEIKKLAKIIVRTALGAKDFFWNTSAERLLTVIFKILKAVDEQYCNLFNAYNLVNLLSYGDKRVYKLISRLSDDFIAVEVKSILSSEPKVLQNIISTCAASLAIYNDPTVAYVTSKDTLNIEDYRTNKRALFINNSVNDIAYYAPISSIFFEQVWGEILSKYPTEEQLPIYFCLDEASSLKLGGGSLSTILSNIRKYSSGIQMAYQSSSQIVSNYGVSDATNIAANSRATLFLPGQDLSTATALMNEGGKFEYIDESDNTRRVRPLATVDEILTMDEAIVRIGNKPLIKTKLYKYFESFKYRYYSSLPAYVPTTNNVPELPPLLPLPE